MTKIDEAYARLATAIVNRARLDMGNKHEYIRRSAQEFWRGGLWANIRDTYNLDEQWTDKIISKWAR